MTELSEESKKAARDFFNRYDRNEDGTLQKRELCEALSAFGIDLDSDGISFIRQTFDTDEDGEVQLDELIDNLHALIQYSVNGKKLEEAFKQLDLNGDGKISSRELKKVLKMPSSFAMSEEEASETVLEMLRKYDTNGDKYFSYQEFVHMMHGEESPEREVDKLFAMQKS